MNKIGVLGEATMMTDESFEKGTSEGLIVCYLTTFGMVCCCTQIRYGARNIVLPAQHIRNGNGLGCAVLCCHPAPLTDLAAFKQHLINLTTSLVMCRMYGGQA